MKKVSLIIFDEAHRAVGDYAYVFIAQQYARLNPKGHVLAMTASPGIDEESISKVCESLNTKTIHSKNYDNITVKPYVKDKKIIPIGLELPEGMSEIKKELEKTRNLLTKTLKERGVINKKYVSKSPIRM